MSTLGSNGDTAEYGVMWLKYGQSNFLNVHSDSNKNYDYLINLKKPGTMDMILKTLFARKVFTGSNK